MSETKRFDPIRLKTAMAAKGITKASTRLGIASASTVDRATRGIPITLEYAASIATALDVALEDLIAPPAPPYVGSRQNTSVGKHLSNAIVLIPAAGPVPDGVFAFANTEGVSLVPLAGKPVLFWQLRYLSEFGLKEFRIAIPKNAKAIREFIESAFSHLSITLVEIESPRGVADTIAKLLPEGQDDRDVLVVLGDTHFEFPLRAGALVGSMSLPNHRHAFVLWDQVKDRVRWCTFHLKPGTDEIVSFIEKDATPMPAGNYDYQALIGVYFIPGIGTLRGAIEHAMSVNVAAVEMSHLLSALVDGMKCPVHAIKAGQWYDVGHSQPYVRANISLLQHGALQPRVFNQLTIDEIMGLITKTPSSAAADSHRQKLIDEINHGRLLPESLKILFPRVVTADSSWASPSLTMEWLGYDRLADLFLFGRLHPEIWRWIFQRIRHVFQKFAATTRPAIRGELKNMLVDKTKKRLGIAAQHFATSENRYAKHLVALLDGNGPQVGGERIDSAVDWLTRVEPAIDELDMRQRDFCVLHGDAVLSNFLFDVPTGICRLVDPRGSFGSLQGVYGAQLYDVAKLMESVHGMYDAIVNDLFAVDDRGDDLVLRYFVPPDHDAIEQAFIDVFFDGAQNDRSDALLVTCCLFLSMLPLHFDDPRRALAMYMRATQLIAEWEKTRS